MAPGPGADDEVVGWEGYVGPGGHVSLRPVRRGERYAQGGGCCLPLVVLVVLGVASAWVLEHCLARPRPPRAVTGPAVPAYTHDATAVLPLTPAMRPPSDVSRDVHRDRVALLDAYRALLQRGSPRAPSWPPCAPCAGCSPTPTGG